MRHAQLALSDDLVGRHSSLGTSHDIYRASVRAIFASHSLEQLPAPIIVDGPLTGVLIALVPALDADGDYVLVPESVWPRMGARPEIAHRPHAHLASLPECPVYCSGSPALNVPGNNNLCAHEPDQAIFTPVRGSCHASAVPDSAVSLPEWLARCCCPRLARRTRAIRLDL